MRTGGAAALAAAYSCFAGGGACDPGPITVVLPHSAAVLSCLPTPLPPLPNPPSSAYRSATTSCRASTTAACASPTCRAPSGGRVGGSCLSTGGAGAGAQEASGLLHADTGALGCAAVDLACSAQHLPPTLCGLGLRCSAGGALLSAFSPHPHLPASSSPSFCSKENMAQTSRTRSELRRVQLGACPPPGAAPRCCPGGCCWHPQGALWFFFIILPALPAPPAVQSCTPPRATPAA